MTKKFILAGIAILAIAICALFTVGPAIQRKIFYPKPTSLPAVVSKTADQLLMELQTTLDKNFTNVAKALRAGLPDSEISALETKFNTTVPIDLRALYKWHNGAGEAEFFPGHSFPSLEDSLKNRALMTDLKSQSRAQRAALGILAGHRKNWIEVFPDGAGDGYFFDSARNEKEGPFFYHMAEAGYYVWFPSIRNFLAALNECYQSGAYRVSTNAASLDADFDKADAISKRYGTSNAE